MGLGEMRVWKENPKGQIEALDGLARHLEQDGSSDQATYHDALGEHWALGTFAAGGDTNAASELHKLLCVSWRIDARADCGAQGWVVMLRKSAQEVVHSLPRTMAIKEMSLGLAWLIAILKARSRDLVAK